MSYSIRTVLLLLAIVLASTWSLVHPDFFYVHDFLHAARVAEMARGLVGMYADFAAEGVVQLPRWSSNFGFGFGMPLFAFYAPLPSVIGAVLYLLGVRLFVVIPLLFGLSSVGAVWGAYLLGKQWYRLFVAISGAGDVVKNAVKNEDAAGLISASVYGLFVYRAVNMFVRGAVSELWAVAFLPWIMLFGLRLLHLGLGTGLSVAHSSVAHSNAVTSTKDIWRAVVLLALSLTGLLLSHNIVSLLFVPLSALFFVSVWLGMWLLLWLQKVFDMNARLAIKASAHEFFCRSLRVGSMFAAAYILAAGLSSFYTLPALIEKDFTQIESTIVGGYFDYAVHFVYPKQLFDPSFGYGGSSYGPDDDMSFFLGWHVWGALGLLGIGVVLTVLRAVRVLRGTVVKGTSVQRAWLLFALVPLGFFALSIVFTTAYSLSLWQALPLLAFVQFPWRWLTIAGLFAALAGSTIAWLVRPRLVGLFASSFVVLGIAGSLQYFQPQEYLEDFSQYYFADAQRIRTEASPVLPDYLPRWLPVAEELEQFAQATDFGQGLGKQVSEQRVYELVERSPQRFELFAPVALGNSGVVDAAYSDQMLTSETWLTLPIAYYPGWEARTDAGQELRVRPNELGLVTVLVDGAQPVRATIRFGSTPVRTLADRLSAVSWVALVLGSFLSYFLSPAALRFCQYARRVLFDTMRSR